MTKWTIPTFHRGQRDFGTGYDMMARIEALEAALNEILREAPSLQYAQGIARDALYPKEGGE